MLEIGLFFYAIPHFLFDFLGCEALIFFILVSK
uniref:Uncharacterized protein n=1 Tax=Utricularia reniformis TaxID=192314 RepID=A0A1Y0B147_9LAMI|nr:hypothetical protein AEK19_MT0848 [Utricularia reniformis]YP_009382289.1 hypothetical protein AEK19_MT1861 [Utricularia reniformis]ART31079.1 hypothetical protein AEK19_MT0848 [Utricularia reniformis]ART32032.1 hypothetical protein AEK19_MT1861 [Utricularia reniformis]